MTDEKKPIHVIYAGGEDCGTTIEALAEFKSGEVIAPAIAPGKTLVAGTNVTITDVTPTGVTINSTGGGGGGSMSNFILEDGDGTEVTISDAKEVKFIDGAGIDINWTDISDGSDGDPYDLTFTVDHDAADNFVPNEHILHTGVNIDTGTGLTGGGDITSTRTLSVVPGDINHDSLGSIPANDHVDHSTVDIATGNGLTGGGHIGSTRTLSVVPADLIGVSLDHTGDNSVGGLGLGNLGGAGAVDDDEIAVHGLPIIPSAFAASVVKPFANAQNADAQATDQGHYLTYKGHPNADDCIYWTAPLFKYFEGEGGNVDQSISINPSFFSTAGSSAGGTACLSLSGSQCILTPTLHATTVLSGGPTCSATFSGSSLFEGPTYVSGGTLAVCSSDSVATQGTVPKLGDLRCPSPPGAFCFLSSVGDGTATTAEVNFGAGTTVAGVSSIGRAGEDDYYTWDNAANELEVSTNGIYKVEFVGVVGVAAAMDITVSMYTGATLVHQYDLRVHSVTDPHNLVSTWVGFVQTATPISVTINGGAGSDNAQLLQGSTVFVQRLA